MTQWKAGFHSVITKMQLTSCVDAFDVGGWGRSLIEECKLQKPRK